MNSASKQIKQALGFGIFSLVALANFAVAQAAEGSGVVAAVSGVVEMAGPDGYSSVSVGDGVAAGDCIRTGSGSTVDIYLDANGPWIKVAPDSEVCIDVLSVQKIDGELVIKTSISLNKGRLLGEVAPISGLSNYEVKTPTGLAKISGGSYDLHVNGYALIEDGVIDLAYIAPKESKPSVVKITSGQSFNPQTGTIAAIDVPALDIQPSLIPWPELPSSFRPGFTTTPGILLSIAESPVEVEPDADDPGTGFVSPVQPE